MFKIVIHTAPRTSISLWITSLLIPFQGGIQKGWKWGKPGIWCQTWLCIPPLLLNDCVPLEKSLTSPGFPSTSVSDFYYLHLLCRHLAPGVWSEASPAGTAAAMTSQDTHSLAVVKEKGSRCPSLGPFLQLWGTLRMGVGRVQEAALVNHCGRDAVF